MESSELREISYSLRDAVGSAVGEFRQAAERNNANISMVVKDIARAFSEQKSELSQLINASEQNITETEKLNSEVQNLFSALQESISVQTSIHGALKNVSEGIGSLSKATEALNDSIAGSGNSVTGLLGGILRAFDFIPGAFKAAVAGITFGAAGGAAYDLMGGGGGRGDAQLTGAGGSYNAEKAAALIRKVGGNEQEATILGAISQPESGGNPNAHNPNRATGDNSYGLWQINMLDKLGPERRAKYGITNNEQLKDPETNARIALQMLREANGVPRDWTTWKHGKHLPYMEAARAGASGKVSSQEGTTPKSDATPTTTSATTPNLTPQSTPMESMTSHDGGGIISSTAKAPSDAKQFLQSREVGRGENTGVQAEKLDGEFATRLVSAIQAAERATNSKVGITEGYRDPHVQAQYYSDYIGKPITYDGKTYQPNPAKFGRLAAPPGRSNHQKGMAADLTESPAREWIRVHASEFGLRQLGSKDMPHFELAGASSREGGSTNQVAYSVGQSGATPAGGGSPITPSMSGDTPSISQQAMASAQQTPMNPEIQKMSDAATNNLMGGGMGMGSMMGMGGIEAMLPPLISSIGSAAMQEPTNATGMLLNNTEQEQITNQLKEAAVSKQAQAEISQEQAATPTQQPVAVPEFNTAGSMYNNDQAINYNNDTGVPEWASKFFLGWHETNKFKTWG